MIAVSNVDMLIKYYETFKAKEHNLKIATIFLYSANEDDKDAKAVILIEPYENYVKLIDEKYDILISIVPSVESVNDLKSEDEQLEFIKAFREIIRVKNTLNNNPQLRSKEIVSRVIDKIIDFVDRFYEK